LIVQLVFARVGAEFEERQPDLLCLDSVLVDYRAVSFLLSTMATRERTALDARTGPSPLQSITAALLIGRIGIPCAAQSSWNVTLPVETSYIAPTSPTFFSSRSFARYGLLSRISFIDWRTFISATFVTHASSFALLQ
jgi:hypothetical protein